MLPLIMAFFIKFLYVITITSTVLLVDAFDANDLDYVGEFELTSNPADPLYSQYLKDVGVSYEIRKKLLKGTMKITIEKVEEGSYKIITETPISKKEIVFKFEELINATYVDDRNFTAQFRRVTNNKLQVELKFDDGNHTMQWYVVTYEGLAHWLQSKGRTVIRTYKRLDSPAGYVGQFELTSNPADPAFSQYLTDVGVAEEVQDKLLNSTMKITVEKGEEGSYKIITETPISKKEIVFQMEKLINGTYVDHRNVTAQFRRVTDSKLQLELKFDDGNHAMQWYVFTYDGLAHWLQSKGKTFIRTYKRVDSPFGYVGRFELTSDPADPAFSQYLKDVGVAEEVQEKLLNGTMNITVEKGEEGSYKIITGTPISKKEIVFQMEKLISSTYVDDRNFTAQFRKVTDNKLQVELKFDDGNHAMQWYVFTYDGLAHWLQSKGRTVIRTYKRVG